ncbi:MAG: cysteine desulfurase NifS [Planctomycetota bacterium]|nr:MAG: cysteine desulfurase NifS [Planctomycetota bacterium]
MIYLDNAATTKPFQSVISCMATTMQENFGNPSSLHRLGVSAANILQDSRKIISDKANVSPESIIFTSGATEANQTVLKCGVHKPNKRRNHILISSFEHPSTLSTKSYLEDMGYEIEFIVPNNLGIITPKAVAVKMRDTTELVSIIGVHNEIGAIQDIKEIKNIIKELNPKTLFHVDGVQWFGKIPLPASNDLPDYFTLSAHKFHGPRGIGAIIKGPTNSLSPLIDGGGQENKFRSGTENLPAIVGMAKAIEEIQDLNTAKIATMQHKLFTAFKNNHDVKWIGPEPGKDRSPFINLIAIKNKKSEILIHQLEEKDIFVSSGSACSEKSNKRNQNYDFLDLGESFNDGILRISFGYHTTEEEVDQLLQELINIL